MLTSRVVAFICIALLFSGCTKTVRHRSAAYYPGTAPTTQPVAKTAVYSIRFLDENGKKFGGMAESHVLVSRGEPIGFAWNEEGKLLAVAGPHTFPIDPAAEHGFVWSATYRQPTQFAKEVAKTMDAAGKAAVIVAVGGILYVGLESGSINSLSILINDSDWCKNDFDEMNDRLTQHLHDQAIVRKRH